MVSSRLSTSASNHLFLLDKWFVRPLLALPDAWAQGPFEYMRILGRIGVPAEVAQLVEQWSEEPCVASSILALGTESLFAGLFPQRVFGGAASATRKQMVRMLHYATLFL